ncbi:MAG: putative acyltransferase (DUF342 family) [Paraglaciecola sp.]|jgi:predicted acyltransferase (DUF342 family)
MRMKGLKTKFAVLLLSTVCLANTANATTGVVAGYCATTFVDGATTHGKGKLKFEDSSSLFNNPDRELASEKIDKDFKKLTLNGSACEDDACTISGTGTNTLDLGAFLESSNTSNNIAVSGTKTIGGPSDDYTGTQFGTVTLYKSALLTFSAEVTEYRIEKLTVQESEKGKNNPKSATLNLVPGDYYIGEFESYGDTIINIIGDGDVRIFLRDHSDFEDNTQVNVAGEAEQLLIYGYDKIHIKNTSHITGLVYSQTKIELKDSTTLIGAASAGDEMKMKDDAEIDYSCAAPPIVDHYQIEHNSAGTVDIEETVTVKACANADCSVLASNAQSTEIFLSSGSGSFSGTNLSFNAGQVTTRLVVNSAQTVTVALQSSLPDAAFICLDELDGNSCDIVFSELGICEAAFPDGLSTHTTGSIFFGENAQLINSADNVLAALNISKNGGSSVKTCNTADCSVAGSLLDTISPGSFQSSSSTDDVNVAYQKTTTLGTRTNLYRNVTSNTEAIINFDPDYDEYKIDQLNLGYQATLNLRANSVYWFNSLTLNEATINVVGEGTAIVFVNNGNLQIASSSLLNSPAINSSGDASKLALYAFGDITLNNQATVSAVVYAQGSLNLGSASYIYGAATASDITLGTDSRLSYQASEVRSGDIDALCTIETVDHYRIEHDGQGLICAAEAITLKACADENCETLFGQQSNLTLSPSAWEGGDNISFKGSTNLSLNYTTAETISFAHSLASPDAPLKCFINNNQSCDFTFAAANPGLTIEAFDTDKQISNLSDADNAIADNFGNVTQYTAIMDVVNFSDGASGGNFAHDAPFFSGAKDDFAVHVTGWVNISTAGYYTFGTNADDGLKLAIDSNSVIYDDNRHAPRNLFGTVSLTAGWHTLDLVFFERGGGAVLELFAASGQHNAFSDTDFQLVGDTQNGGLVTSVSGQVCAAQPIVDHYRIEHDGQGFTCEAETVTIKACENADCTQLYDQATQISLSPTGWAGSDTISFTGSISTAISHTTADTITLGKTTATPEADVTCFNSDAQTCALEFVNDGFAFFAATPGEKILGDQLAEINFSDVNIRAVRDNNGVCESLLEGTQNTTFTYNCISPDSCLSPFGGISVDSSNPSGDQSGALDLTFNSQGIASLSQLNYGDAGRLQLSVQAVVDGVTLTSGSAQVDVVPTSLALDVVPASLVYTAAGDTDTYTAGKTFNFSISAYGAAGTNPLPNYQPAPGSLQLKLTRNQPTSASATNGTLSYDAGAISSALTPDFIAILSPTFKEGVYSYSANYDEVGQITLDVQDSDYLGNIIDSQGGLTLGEFVPAYFAVEREQQPQLQDTCAATFTYIGEEITFDTGHEAIIKITAKNALDTITHNYSGNLWTYLPNLADVNDRLSYMDSSNYGGTATVVLNGQAPLVSDNTDYDGTGLVSVDGYRFRYDKVGIDTSAFDIAPPFTASVDMVFSADFLSDDNGVCFKDNNADTSCNAFTISAITGANLRYGRLVLDNTYGPETEALMVNIKAQYYDQYSQWALNTDDNCTAIDFTEAAGQLSLSDRAGSNIAALIEDVEAAGNGTGMLSSGESDDDLLISSPGKGNTGELDLSLIPTAPDVVWPAYLNFDWDGNGNIDNDDFPDTTVIFGQFRGNDKIIQWREVFN